MTVEERLDRAARFLAIGIDIDDRIATDPTFAADRGPGPDRKRAARRAEQLAEFRAALADYNAPKENR